ncbi:MAG: tryptophan--tRNA ligase [Holophagaceae bacterium]|nr:tryptophan--tRNA ligase [Holophagaceae bacterium]
MPEPRKNRVFSGVQPTGKLHIGNYLGAISQWAENQDDFENLFCVVDLHAITIPAAISPKAFHAKTLEVTALYLACGIDPAKSTIFLQSHVPEHSELAWLLNCVTPLGWLYRMTQFKAKAGTNQMVGTGLLDYPVLMAADILLYDAHYVPVGEDQKQHIEFTRDLAQRCNAMFNTRFIIPEAQIRSSGARIMGLDDPNAKMSKSIGEQKRGHSIGLLDAPSAIKKAIMSATTDGGNEARFGHAGVGVRNLLELYAVLSKRPHDEIEAEFHGHGYGKLKKSLVELVVETLRPIQERHVDLMKNQDHIRAMLDTGARRARTIAAVTVTRVRDAMGFVRSNI